MKKNHRRKNPVARVLNQVNKPQTHRLGTDYRRQPKHRNRVNEWLTNSQ